MKNLFNKITSQFNEVTKRTLIVLQFPLPIFLISFVTAEEDWTKYKKHGMEKVIDIELIQLLILISLSFSMAFFIIVASVNWILKGKGK